MKLALFMEFVTYLDHRMSCKNRKIVLLLDQCAAHPKHMTLQSIKVVFLPLNATSRLQPLDAGIIRNIKHHFKGLLVRRLLAKIDRKDANMKISLLDAMHFIAVAWECVSPATIADCFAKCGIFKSTVATTSQVPDPIQADVWNQLGVDCSVDDFFIADNDLVTCGQRTVEDIVEDVSSQPGISTSDDEEDECQNGDDQPPSAAATMDALDILRHAVTSQTVGEDTTAQFSFENSLLADLAKTKTQKDIRDFCPRK
ncbi:tigger transposable element-derived protein 6-like [Dermacentor andersoni]|uniref:tigger transposable element-derived protein 6-like n=1 Tax=Dermacentor andersoni TaxID=34620 RepID=UPI00215542CB|nr:tigger transposable element-derived protein 6-like [Dermacentor andersoni]